MQRCGEGRRTVRKSPGGQSLLSQGTVATVNEPQRFQSSSRRPRMQPQGWPSGLQGCSPRKGSLPNATHEEGRLDAGAKSKPTPGVGAGQLVCPGRWLVLAARGGRVFLQVQLSPVTQEPSSLLLGRLALLLPVSPGLTPTCTSCGLLGPAHPKPVHKTPKSLPGTQGRCDGPPAPCAACPLLSGR